MNFSVFLVSFFTWILLTGSFDWQEIIVGLVVSFFISIIFKRYYRISFGRNFLIGLFKFLFVYVPVFTWEMLKANVDVASRLWSNKGNVRPGFVKVKTELKGDVEKLLLANSITLTPGTITMDIVGDELYVHWIDVAGVDNESKKVFYGRFEKILKGVCK